MQEKRKRYKEVKLPDNRFYGAYRNPLAGTFRYEYALYVTVSDFFASVTCRSLCMERLRLYFTELKRGSDAEIEADAVPQESPDVSSKKTQESILKEVSVLVDRDVRGKVNFPAMHECRAEFRTIPEKDGSHTFVFTDGVYGFSLRLDMTKKGSPKRILVADLFPDEDAAA